MADDTPKYLGYAGLKATKKFIEDTFTITKGACCHHQISRCQDHDHFFNFFDILLVKNTTAFIGIHNCNVLINNKICRHNNIKPQRVNSKPQFYFPIQKLPKILSRISSTSILPVIFPNSRAAKRISSAVNSISLSKPKR